MGTAELKSNIHQIVDSIQNEQLLQTLYDFLKTRKTSTPGELWETLTDEQKQEVLVAHEESEHENYLIDSDKVFKKVK